jgi:hypothetical protein
MQRWGGLAFLDFWLFQVARHLKAHSVLQDLKFERAEEGRASSPRGSEAFCVHMDTLTRLYS